MDEATIKRRLIAALKRIAPETEEAELDCGINLQEQLDLDSVDVMNYLRGVQDDFGIEIPNRYFQEFLTIDGAARYLQQYAAH